MPKKSSSLSLNQEHMKYEHNLLIRSVFGKTKETEVRLECYITLLKKSKRIRLSSRIL